MFNWIWWPLVDVSITNVEQQHNISLYHVALFFFRYVLYKERNMLLTELQLSRRRGILFPQPDRMKKVRKSMGAIRHVLGERKREKIAAFKLNQEDIGEQEVEDKVQDN
jgi:Mitochondrial 39-S ribosomal protein L47 (MRP-L47)